MAISMLGEITASMRHVCWEYDGKYVRLVIYMEKEPSDDERECGEIIAVNFDAGLGHRLDGFHIDFIVTLEPIGRLNTYDICLFIRNEVDFSINKLQ